MNGTDMKKAAINKAKQVAHAANSNGGKKRRKGQDLKPIITTENQGNQNASPAGSTGSFQYKYVHHHYHHHHHHLYCPPLDPIIHPPARTAPLPHSF
jgi:serine/threonine-protein kinase SRPK3